MENLKPGSTAAPRVLLTDTNRWALAARLAISLNEAGCEVYAVCPTPGHALLKTRAVKRTFSYSGFRPLESLTAAIEAVDPDVLIPSCDRGVGHFHELYQHAKACGAAGSRMAELIERSLGAPASHAVVSSRYDLLELAREEGVRVPNTGHLDTPEDIRAWQATEAFPWVVKVDGTWGGGGVKIVHSQDELHQAFAQIARMFRFGRAVKRIIVNRDTFELRPWWNQSQRAVVAQSYIQGYPANCAVFCWRGRVLAGIGVEVVSTDGLTGPANIVRVVNNPEMMFAAERIASRLDLSGIFGLDFMIDGASRNAYLIEMNPRATPLCHFRLGKGRDMAGALWAQLVTQPIPDVPPATSKDLIAYFPYSAGSNGDSTESYFLDEPRGEPELAQELVQPWPDRTFLFRLFTRFGRKSESGPQSKIPAPMTDESDGAGDYAYTGAAAAKSGPRDKS